MHGYCVHLGLTILLNSQAFYVWSNSELAIMSEVTDQVEFFESEQIDSEPQTSEQETELEKEGKLLKLPLSRIRTIIKQDPDVHLASHDSVVLIAKATVSTYRDKISVYMYFIVKVVNFTPHFIFQAGTQTHLWGGGATGPTKKWGLKKGPHLLILSVPHNFSFYPVVPPC